MRFISGGVLAVDGNNARRAIVVFRGRVYTFTVFGPAEAAVVVDLDQV